MSKLLRNSIQTKVHFKDKSSLALVTETIDKLKDYANTNKDKTIAITYLGTGYGGLNKDMIKKQLGLLPDNTTLWEI